MQLMIFFEMQNVTDNGSSHASDFEPTFECYVQEDGKWITQENYVQEDGKWITQESYHPR